VADLFPERRQVGPIRLELGGSRPPAGGAHDEPAVVAVAHPHEDLLQARSLLFVLDAAGDADVIDRRHENEEPAGQRDVSRDARALARDRVLRDLDDDSCPSRRRSAIEASGRGAASSK
jgi:hypothetical protein